VHCGVERCEVVGSGFLPLVDEDQDSDSEVSGGLAKSLEEAREISPSMDIASGG
jgi:hypothetical protein